MTFKWNLFKNGEIEEVFYTDRNISLNEAIELCGITDANDSETEYELVFADEPKTPPYMGVICDGIGYENRHEFFRGMASEIWWCEEEEKKEYVANALEDAWLNSDIGDCTEWVNTEEAIFVADKAIDDFEA